MKKTIQFNAKCRQCMHFEILNSDEYFLDEDEFYCKLDNSLKTDEDECSKLELDEKGLKTLLKDAGIFNVRIVQMKATELLKEFEDIINSSGEDGKVTFYFNKAYQARVKRAISELEALQNENKSLVKTLEKYNEEMIELRKCNQDLLNTVIEAQKVIKNVMEGKK